MAQGNYFEVDNLPNTVHSVAMSLNDTYENIA